MKLMCNTFSWISARGWQCRSLELILISHLLARSLRARPAVVEFAVEEKEKYWGVRVFEDLVT